MKTDNHESEEPSVKPRASLVPTESFLLLQSHYEKAPTVQDQEEVRKVRPIGATLEEVLLSGLCTMRLGHQAVPGPNPSTCS